MLFKYVDSKLSYETASLKWIKLENSTHQAEHRTPYRLKDNNRIQNFSRNFIHQM